MEDGGAQFSVQPDRSRLTCGRGRERKIERASCLCHGAAIALSFPAKINAGVSSGDRECSASIRSISGLRPPDDELCDSAAVGNREEHLPT